MIDNPPTPINDSARFFVICFISLRGCAGRIPSGFGVLQVPISKAEVNDMTSPN